MTMDRCVFLRERSIPFNFCCGIIGNSEVMLLCGFEFKDWNEKLVLPRVIGHCRRLGRIMQFLEAMLLYSQISEFWRLSTSNTKGDHELIEQKI